MKDSGLLLGTTPKYTLSYSARLYFLWRPISRHILNNLALWTENPESW